ncbi:terminase small subunit [Vallitalea sp.]|jgi:phage terminase small subunit|uniref:terminase small subunit n=1 Tax=Vallitalea sp. TaxID=1882829 RepID=UPI0025E558C0|nr:terminase small subunit [Vallitalea sp.]MCT4686611.1 terminase small subunit [Vallitalea sp.]
MTDQEKKFADEYIFRYFNSDECSWINAVEAAKQAGYTLPKCNLGAEGIAKALFNKGVIKNYIESQIQAFKEKLNPSQRRKLWIAIAEMTIDDPSDWDNWGFVNH